MPLPVIATPLRSRTHDVETHDSSSLEFGIYRDGDNNLDEAQSAVLNQAQSLSAKDPDIAFHVKDTTQRDDGLDLPGQLRTEEYNLADGSVHDLHTSSPQDMADRSTLAKFVANTLDQAQTNNASSTWLDLVDHGGGNGGAFQTNSSGGHVMREDDIAGAIADGLKMHALDHPDDANRSVDGVVFNACLMATCGMESALSHVGVKYLAASPETMIAPGAPSSIAQDIAHHQDDPIAMAKAVVQHTMGARYGIGDERFGPAAAFDVLNLDPQKIATMEQSIKAVNQEIVAAAKDPGMRSAIKSDGRNIEGMTRSQEPKLPWHADRPAEELYNSLAGDTRLTSSLREAAKVAESAVAATVIAHRESSDFAPFGDESYRDAVGPTVHFPTTKNQVDPWAPVVSETKNAFSRAVGEQQLDRALA